MVNKLHPIPPYSTIYQPPLEVAHPCSLRVLNILLLGGGSLCYISEEKKDGGSYVRRFFVCFFLVKRVARRL